MGKENEYYDIIKSCAKNREDFTIQNSANEHAAYLIKTLFKYAEEEVIIFTGSLHEDVFSNEDLKKEAVEFLKKGTGKRLVIAYQNEAKEKILQGSFLKAITSAVDKTTGKLEIWDAQRTNKVIENHFAVMDSRAFRYELELIRK